jgi:NitT/TauT family transport system permease protein
MQPRKTWGTVLAGLYGMRLSFWVDLLLIVGLAGALWGIVDLAGQWTTAMRPTVDIDLDDAWALPRYTLYSLMRGLAAYVISLGFTLVYGYWAAKDRQAERVLMPLLDILQSIPVLSFMPGLVLALVAVFPTTNIGLELAAVIMIFTGQAWNMTFSYHHSLRSVPNDLREVAAVYRFTWWQTLKWVELPFATMGLVWNSMMSMAGGWFFLTASEAFQLGDKDFRLPGVGSYVKEAVKEGRWDAMAMAILAMVAMIVLLDQLLWRPVVVWAQKFRFEEGGQVQAQTSWFLTWLRRSEILVMIQRWWQRLTAWVLPAARTPAPPRRRPRLEPGRLADWVARTALVALLLGLLYGAWNLVGLLRQLPGEQWLETVTAAACTLGRVLVSTALGTLWAVPVGLWIGMSARLSRVLQPVVQVLASFPAPMLFPLVVAVLDFVGVPLDWGSILLMLMGTQWYILFNVMAGAMAIPADLQEAARSYRVVGWRRFWTIHVPAIFPYLVTGWVTAAGGAWNASIVSEYITVPKIQKATGLGALINIATEQENYPLLAASTLVMSIVVVAFNRTVWRYCYRLAEERFSLNK